MKTKGAFVLGAAAGYVLGARAGRARYEQIRTAASAVASDRRVQGAANEVVSRAGEAAVKVGGAVQDKVVDGVHLAAEKLGHSEPEGQTPAPGAVPSTLTE